MLRTAFAGLALTLGALTCLPAAGFAAGRNPPTGSPAAGVHYGGPGGRGLTQRLDHGRRQIRGDHRQDRHRGRDWGGPALYGYGYGREPVVREVEVERPAQVDPFAFANLPVRMGIPYPPTPEPTIYRLEGRRDRPVTRVIGINEERIWGSRPNRFVHAETGAVLLTVPRR